MSLSKAFASLVLFTFLLGGCASSGGTSQETGAEETGAEETGAEETGETGGEVTGHRDARVIVETRCAGCHIPGGIAPFPLTSYDEASAYQAAIKFAVESGSMPPWPPAESCLLIEDIRALDDDEKDVLLAWIDGGAVEGDPGDHVPPPEPPSPPGDPSLSIQPAEAYEANANKLDDYRCFVLDHDFDESIWINGMHIRPQELSVAHHALIYLASEEDDATLALLEGEDKAPGYECFGGPIVGGQTIGGWAPGVEATYYPENTGIRIPAQARLVRQMHYNTFNVPPGETAPPDLTTVDIWTLEEDPESEILLIPIIHGDLSIPPGEVDWVESATFPVPVESTLIGFAPHMHLLGTQTSVTLLEPDGTEQCLIDIPEWDFAWQQFYMLEEDSFVSLNANHSLEMQCTYDNSAENQPIINGVQEPPTQVHWGDNTLDEMCITYLVLMQSLGPQLPEDGCGELAECLDPCDGDGACFNTCLASAPSECTQCFLSKIGDCAGVHCPSETQAVLGCLGGCGEGIAACLNGACASQTDILYSCLDAPLEDGLCDASLGDYCKMTFGE